MFGIFSNKLDFDVELGDFGLGDTGLDGELGEEGDLGLFG